MSEPVAHLVQVQQLTRVYRAGARQVHALQGVDLTVGRGEFVALRGRSGSGKTTLLNCIGGLDQPTHGIVRVYGAEIGRWSEGKRTKWRREQVGFIFQSLGLLPVLSAYENVELVLADIKMPVMDGLQAASAIRALDRPDAKTIPILALSANTYEEDVRRSLEAGMNAHLAKPIEVAELSAALHRFIR